MHRSFVIRNIKKMNDDDNWERSAFENEEEDEDNSPVLQKFKNKSS